MLPRIVRWLKFNLNFGRCLVVLKSTLLFYGKKILREAF
jgi:hypothetical protein